MRNLLAVVLTIFCAVSLSAESRFVSAHKVLTPFRGGVLWTPQLVPGQMQFSDGTPAGTYVLAEEANSFYPVATCGSWAVFAATTPAEGLEPWVTDGTVSGTMLLRDLMPGESGSNPRAVCVDGVALISAGQALWRTNGTPGGTVLVATFTNEIAPMPVRAGHQVFLASAYAATARLWRSDGTAAGTVVVKDFAGTNAIEEIKAAGDDVYVVTYDIDGQKTLWFSDGTTAGTVPLRTAKEIDLHADFYGRLTYSWSNAAGVFQGFCTTDGTSAGSCFLPAGATLPYLLSMKPFAGRLYYNWDDLRSTDGTTELATGITGAETIFSTGAGRLFLHSTLNSTVGERRLQESDGTVAGTHSLRTHTVYDAAVSAGRLFIYDGDSPGLSTVDLDVAPTGFGPSSVAVPGGQTVTITGRGFTGPVTIRVGGVNAAIGTVTPTSIAFTAPPLTAGFHDIDLTLGDGRRMTLEQPLIYTCSAPTAFITTPPATVCPFQPKTLHGNGGTRCSWSPSTGLDDPSSCTPTATISDTTTYTLVVYSADGCASTNNPSISLTKEGPPFVGAISPLVANPGTMMTVVGSGLQCVTSVAVVGVEKDWSRGVGFSILNGATLRFPHPGGSPRRLRVSVSTSTGTAGGGMYQRSSRRDFDGGTVADVFWRNTSTGQNSLWSMASDTFRGEVVMTVPTSWSPVAIGDVNGDIRADVFWTNPATGETSIWLMNGPAVMTAVRSTSVPVAWKPIGSADFNGDGKDDLFWHNPTTGETSIWLMNGTTFTGLRSLTVPATWKPVAFGDFNGDAKGDVFWRNPSTGETSIWLMNGGMPSTTVRSDTLAGPWSVAGSGDLDGDGKEDLFWWNSATGETLCRYLNGATIRAKESRLVMAAGWKPVQVGHFDANETADVFWHNTTTGETRVWQMAPGYLGSWSPLTVPDPNWKPVILP